MNDFKSKLTQMFKNMRKDGLIARQNFQCCQGCGTSAIAEDPRWEKGATGYAFYHKQDTEDIAKGFVHIAFGTLKGKEEDDIKVGLLILKAAASVGLCVAWNGSTDQRITVLDHTMGVK